MKLKFVPQLMKLKTYLEVSQDADVSGLMFAGGVLSLAALLFGLYAFDQVHDWLCAIYGWEEWK